LGVVHQYSDRRYDQFLALLFPEALGDLVNIPSPSQARDVITPAMDAISSKTTRRTKKKQASSVTEVASTTYIDYRKPPAMISLFWFEIIQYCQSILDGLVDETLDEAQLRQVQIVDGLIEFCKTLFYCPKMVKRGMLQYLGLSLEELETGPYRQLRASLDSIFKNQ
jgi:hypothetical protein